MVLNDTSIPTLAISSTSSTSEPRTLWDIIWSCGVTLFAWTWTAIHPNIPGLEDSKVTIMRRRLSLMIEALFFPELFITWAALQFFSARHTVKEFNTTFLPRGNNTRATISDWLCMWLKPWPSNETKSPLGRLDARTFFSVLAKYSAHPFTEWTLKHGFFGWMGGFMLCVDEKPYATLTPDELIRFIQEGYVDIPKISGKEIADRSKGDELSKGIATLQLAWFILQFIARSVQNLQNTLLEVDTLAVAAMTCIAHGFWWHKPKDVGLPWLVHWKKENGSPPPPSELFYWYDVHPPA